MKSPLPHQYIDRKTLSIKTEKIYNDKIINGIYGIKRENASALFKVLTSARLSWMLGFITYDMPFGANITGAKEFGNRMGIDLSECVEPIELLNTARKVFERKIRYWETRPMPDDPFSIVSPADAKIIVGSFCFTSQLFLKEKFFNFKELLGENKQSWLDTFQSGDFAIFRLTPDKYHYNHAPVSGKVIDIYEIDGQYYPCNPGAIMACATPFSKNKRVITIIDTDVENGTKVGKVAMIEIVALMIGDIVQAYSDRKYDSPKKVEKGLFIKKGQPKSLYRPGSSTDVLIFEKGKVNFSKDIIINQNRYDVKSRFSNGFDHAVVETEVDVRSQIGKCNFLSFE